MVAAALAVTAGRKCVQETVAKSLPQIVKYLEVISNSAFLLMTEAILPRSLPLPTSLLILLTRTVVARDEGKAKVCKRKWENVTVSNESCFIPEAEGEAHLDIKIKVLSARKERMLWGPVGNALYMPYSVKGHMQLKSGQKLLSR